MNLFFSIFCSFFLAFFAYVKRALTIPALLVAFLFSVGICYYGNFLCFFVLCVVFFGTVITKRLKYAHLHQKRFSNPKRVVQILANVSVGFICLVFYHFSSQGIWYLLYFVSMAEALSDTFASNIGCCSSKDPINILTWQRGMTGLSGNVSFLGIGASFLAASLISFLFLLFHFDLIGFMAILLCSFIGAILDSYFGALFQVKYLCPHCHMVTEATIHCGEKTKYYRGLSLMDNNAVNFISNLCSVVLAFLFVLLF